MIVLELRNDPTSPSSPSRSCSSPPVLASSISPSSSSAQLGREMIFPLYSLSQSIDCACLPAFPSLSSSCLLPLLESREEEEASMHTR